MSRFIIYASKHSEIYLAQACAYIVGLLFFELLIGGFLNRVGIRGIESQYLIKLIIYIFVIFRAMLVVKKRFSVNSLIVILFFVASYCITFITNPRLVSTDIDFMRFWMHCIPGFLIFASIRDFKVFFEKLNFYMYYVFFAGMIYFYGFALGNIQEGMKYDMVFSYTLVVPILFFCHTWLTRGLFFEAILALVGIFSIIMIGSRGALICVILFFLFQIVFGDKKDFKKKVFPFLVLSSLIVTLILGLDMVTNVVSYLQNYNIASRTLIAIANQTITDDSNRLIILQESLELIISNPIGVGLFEDRVLLDGYPHNFIIEILIQYGFIIGSILIIYFTTLIIRYSVSLKQGYSKDIFIIMISYTVAYKALSGSYLNDPDVLMLLGLLMNFHKNGVINKT